MGMSLGLTAAIGAAAGASCAVAATGGLALGGLRVPVLAYGLGLLPGVVAAAARPERRWGGPAIDLRRFSGPAAGLALLAVAALEGGVADRLATVGPYLALGVVVTSAAWPAPAAVRAGVLLAAAGLLGAGPEVLGRGWALAGALAGGAVALVAAERLAGGATDPARPPGHPDRRRVGRAAALVAAVAGLAGLLGSALLPPPTGGDGGGSGGTPAPSGGGGEPAPLQPARLDVAGAHQRPGRDLVLRVAAPGPDVWRLGTYDRWDGRGWERTRRPAATGATAAPGRTVVSPFVPSDVGFGEPFRHRVTVEADLATALPAAPVPWSLTVAGAGGRADADGWLAPLLPLGRGATYSVESRRGPPPPGAALPEPPATYLHLPPTSGRVGALAATITAGAAGAPARAAALERWLDDHVAVLDDAPALPPGDAVEALLFADRAGTPARLASALAVMLRSLGVPARVGFGFLPGRRALLGGEFEVRADDAHVWAEAWSPDTGWRRYDPTGRIASAMAEDSLLARLGRLLAALWPLLLAVAAGVVAWIGWRFVARRRERRAQPWSTRLSGRLARAGAGLGRPRAPHETPAEYSEALAATVLPDHRLAEVGRMVTRAAYSPWAPSAEERAWADRVLREAVAAAPARPRRGRRPPGWRRRHRTRRTPTGPARSPGR